MVQIPDPTITIPAPRFEKGELVWLRLETSTIPTSIKARAYDPDRTDWYYQASLTDQWYKADELTHRNAAERTPPIE